MSSLLVLGGARSGKSSFAQARAEDLPGDLVYIATAQAFDDEMVERITLHRLDRGPRWATVEAPIDLAEAIKRRCAPDSVVLVDCLTLWLSNLMLAEYDVARASERLVATITDAPGALIFVANEVGLGIVPDNALARRFRDAAGRLNQMIAKHADEVVFIAAGLPLRLK
jgi:adenosylcobinamide kinase/adenosylcobinamide-phosphate guanylyltransferase